MAESLGAEVTVLPGLGVPIALRDGLEAPELLMPRRPPRFCFFAASNLFLYSGRTFSEIVVPLAFFSCSYEAMLLCSAASAASAPAVAGSFVALALTSARWVITVSK